MDDEEWQEECRYSQDKPSGFFIETVKYKEVVKQTTSRLIADKKELVAKVYFHFDKYQYSKQNHNYRDLSDGLEVVLSLDGQNVWVQTPKVGDAPATSKKYVLPALA